MRVLLASAALLLAGCAAPPPVAPPPDTGGGDLVVRAVGGGTNNVFDPPRAEVATGGVVRWVGDSGHHTVTFEGPVVGNDTAPDSGDLEPSERWPVTFPRAGTFRYRCIYHSSGYEPGQGMVGSVVVA